MRICENLLPHPVQAPIEVISHHFMNGLIIDHTCISLLHWLILSNSVSESSALLSLSLEMIAKEEC